MNDSLTVNLRKNHSKFKSYYENLNASKQIKFNSDYSIHTFKKYKYQITNLMDEKIILEQIIKKLENQKKRNFIRKRNS